MAFRNLENWNGGYFQNPNYLMTVDLQSEVLAVEHLM